MSVRAKNYDRLDLLDAAFQKELRLHLQDVAAGNNSLFFQACRYAEVAEYRHGSSNVTDRMLAQADAIINLRQQLDEPVDRSLAYRFQTACQAICDTSNHHRLGPINLAQELLDEIAAG